MYRNAVYYADQHLHRANVRKEWTKEEDDLVLNPGTLTDHELAELLERTTHGVDMRRYTLRKKVPTFGDKHVGGCDCMSCRPWTT